jgi:hypothetical protein
VSADERQLTKRLAAPVIEVVPARLDPSGGCRVQLCASFPGDGSESVLCAAIDS